MEDHDPGDEDRDRSISAEVSVMQRALLAMDSDEVFDAPTILSHQLASALGVVYHGGPADLLSRVAGLRLMVDGLHVRLSTFEDGYRRLSEEVRRSAEMLNDALDRINDGQLVPAVTEVVRILLNREMTS